MSELPISVYFNHSPPKLPLHSYHFSPPLPPLYPKGSQGDLVIPPSKLHSNPWKELLQSQIIRVQSPNRRQVLHPLSEGIRNLNHFNLYLQLVLDTSLW
uniref:Uncharacterized protein n=1 Tax=Arundo donax TaxID=35708 RepID=A0A0A8Y6Z9_ARUDO